MRQIATASSSPGTAATTNGARQLPRACTIGPTVKKASITPSGRASMNSEIARARVADGNRSPIRELAVGA